MIFNLNDNIICDNSASIATVTSDFLKIINWIFVDCALTFFKFNILNDSNSIKLLLNAWTLIIIFWNYCFKRRVRCRLWKRNIVAFASQSCWLRKLLILSFCFAVKFEFAFAIRLRVFSIDFKFFSKFLKREV